MANKKPLIVIGGPTASGKTALAVFLAKELNTEIISADSMQVYKMMDIGTAKPTMQEMQGIPHHLIDAITPDTPYSAAVFSDKAKEHIAQIHAQNRIPILVGGTGFYINALLRNTEFTATASDFSIRDYYWALSKEKGNAYIHQILNEVDKASAKAIHPNNVKRVIRAIEYYELTGTQISAHNQSAKQMQCPYQCTFIALNLERDTLYNRINSRVDAMIGAGLIDEVHQLLTLGYHRNLTAMQGIGYKEIAAYLAQECTLNEAVSRIKTATRRYAKRQFTWFRNQTDAFWFDADKIHHNSEFFLKKIIQSIDKSWLLR